MLGALAGWTARGPALIRAPELYTGTHGLAAGLYAHECERTDVGVAWTLLGGWRGLHPPSGWALGLRAFLGPFRLDDDCPGTANRLILCAVFISILTTRAPTHLGHPRTRVRATCPRPWPLSSPVWTPRPRRATGSARCPVTVAPSGSAWSSGRPARLCTRRQSELASVTLATTTLDAGGPDSSDSAAMGGRPAPYARCLTALCHRARGEQVLGPALVRKLPAKPVDPGRFVAAIRLPVPCRILSAYRDRCNLTLSPHPISFFLLHAPQRQLHQPQLFRKQHPKSHLVKKGLSGSESSKIAYRLFFGGFQILYDVLLRDASRVYGALIL